jgi:GT2 family glycosyltransferase
MIVTVVIPTHNRGPKLAPTLELLLANDPTGFDEVEVVVVDDGSATPAGPLLDGLRVPPPFTLRCLRLEPNVGPAGARNAGFRAARGDVVLFVDDDILCPPDLIRGHVEAHRARPGSVICGAWHLAEPEPMTPLFRYVATLGFDCGVGQGEEFVPIDIVSSGHISVERAMFPPDEGVYRDGLAVPAAEEYELALRLRERGIPILLARRIGAVHDHPVTLDGMCRQAFKHAMGCAEAAIKSPGTLSLPGVRSQLDANGPITRRDAPSLACKKFLKGLLATAPARAGLLKAAHWAERVAPRPGPLAPLYRAVMGLHVFGGFREGWRLNSR